MTEFERKLSSLTPAAVDRDALLYASGRASAPSPRWWKRACGLLVVTQMATLGVWLGERRRSLPAAEPPPADVAPVEPLPLSPPDPASYLVLLRTWDESAPPTPPAAGGEPRRLPPLTAGSRDFY